MCERIQNKKLKNKMIIVAIVEAGVYICVCVLRQSVAVVEELREENQNKAVQMLWMTKKSNGFDFPFH